MTFHKPCQSMELRFCFDNSRIPYRRFSLSCGSGLDILANWSFEVSFIKQPDGRWAIWSGITDSFTFLNATKEEAVEEIVSSQMKDLRENLTRCIDKIDRGEVISQFTMTFDGAIQTMRDIHGDKEADEVLREVRKEF